MGGRSDWNGTEEAQLGLFDPRDLKGRNSVEREEQSLETREGEEGQEEEEGNEEEEEEEEDDDEGADDEEEQ